MFVSVLDSKVVHDEGESDRACVMTPEAWGYGAWCIPVGGKELLELLVGQELGLGEAIHAALNFNIDVPIVDQGVEPVVVHDVSGEHGDRDARVCIILGLHGGAQIKIFEITHHAFGMGCGDYTVEEDLDSGEVHSFGADIASIVNAITTHSPTDVVGDGFFGVEGTDHTEIGGFGAWGELADGNEMHCVGSGSFGCALCKAMDLSSVRGPPQGTIAAAAQFRVFSQFPRVGVESVAMQCPVWGYTGTAGWCSGAGDMSSMVATGVIAWGMVEQWCSGSAGSGTSQWGCGGW